MRRPFLALLLPILLAAGCGAEPEGEAAARAAFLERNGEIEDYDLALICPGLYPRDYRAEPDKYNYQRPDERFRPTAAQRADARRTPGCAGPGTRPDAD